MIHALLHNRRSRTLFKTDEDALTSSVFERVSYLPKELLHHIIANSLHTPSPELNLISIQEFDFWPKWDGSKTKNSKYVEPDIFIRTEKIDVIIESKRWDKNQQNKGQWKREFAAYLNEFKEDNKPVILIALGGLWNTERESIVIEAKEYSVYKCSWTNIVRTIENLLKDMESTSQFLHSNWAIQNILQDLLYSLQVFGYHTYYWFQDMPRVKGASKKSLSKIQTLPSWQ